MLCLVTVGVDLQMPESGYHRNSYLLGAFFVLDFIGAEITADV